MSPDTTNCPLWGRITPNCKPPWEKMRRREGQSSHGAGRRSKTVSHPPSLGERASQGQGIPGHSLPFLNLCCMYALVSIINNENLEGMGTGHRAYVYRISRCSPCGPHPEGNGPGLTSHPAHMRGPVVHVCRPCKHRIICLRTKHWLQQVACLLTIREQ